MHALFLIWSLNGEEMMIFGMQPGSGTCLWYPAVWIMVRRLLEAYTMHIAKLFVNGRSQAVRILRSLAIKGISEVAVRREGNMLIPEPLRKTWTLLPVAGTAADDLMSERPDVMETDRVNL